MPISFLGHFRVAEGDVEGMLTSLWDKFIKSENIPFYLHDFACLTTYLSLLHAYFLVYHFGLVKGGMNSPCNRNLERIAKKHAKRNHQLD